MADEEMPRGEPTTSSIVAAYDWGALGHVVDVGGGNGTLLIALLTEYPALRGTVVDLPDVAENARKMLAAAGLADRGDAVAGDFFGSLPAGAEGYLLCSVLHQWSDEEARAILRNCASAAAEDGAVFVIEAVPDAAAEAAAARAGDEPPASAGAGAEPPVAAGGVASDAVTGPVSSAVLDLPTDATSPLLEDRGRERDVGELTVLAQSAGLTVSAVHTAGAVAILELALP